MGIHTLRDGISGSSDICEEAGIVICGYLSIADGETKFGLFVNETIQPDKINSNGCLKKGGAQILTKNLSGHYYFYRKKSMLPSVKCKRLCL